jgi:hypothetical protein
MSNFEERLLSALKEEITTRTAEEYMTTVAPVLRGSRRRLAGLSAAVAGVAAATTAAVMILNGVAGSPAYAVTKGPDGGVSVQINAFTDPEGLEAELAAAGVKAVVDYLPPGQTCQESRGQRGSASGQFAGSIGRGSGGIGISFKIEKGQVPAGETLVLAVSKSKDGDDQPPFGMSVTTVKGAVADCVPTAAPIPSADGDGGVTVDKQDDGGAGFHVRKEGEDAGPGLTRKTE